jgi:endonuclease/exonuclease/phosphatase family metal-dependent hydrolase
MARHGRDETIREFTMKIRMKVVVSILLLGVTVHGCGDEADQGEFSLLTYNVAGLPEPLSGSSPSVNTPQISPMLNAYGLVLVQEDFWYHHELVARVDHPYRSMPMWEQPGLLRMGDGLNRFSVFPLGELTRVTWIECNGVLDCASDCLTTKGFSVSAVKLAEGLVVDVYNLHMDAGGCDGDIHARGVQTKQLLERIRTRSAGKAAIVAGDTNLKNSRPDDVESLESLLSEANLREACLFLNCEKETIDRVLFRGSDSVSLVPISWDHPPQFVDAEGHDLSDHKPVAVRFHWEETPVR